MLPRRSTRSTTKGNPIEPIIENIPPELSDEPIKRPRKTKPTIASIPGSEYVSDTSLPACETDSDGLKGKTFLNFVYNQLKVGSNQGITTPKVYIMMGPPGAGKSTIKKTFDINNYINIDLDEIKKLCVKCFPDSPSVRGFGIIGNLKRIAKQLLELAVNDNMNILFDTTGRMTEVVETVINTTKSAGYQQIFIIIYTSLENCLTRAEMRNTIETDREPMAPFMIKSAYESFMDKSSKGVASYYLIANKALTENADELYVFDNNGSTPQLLFKRVNGIVETVIETPNFYNMSINSTEPYFTLNGRGGRRTRRRKARKSRKSRKN
jgi:predicted kinase